MWRTLRNRHLAATHGSPSAHLAVMLFAAVSGLVFLTTQYPRWRIALVIGLPALMGTIEMLLARRTAPDDFDRVYQILGIIGALMLGVLVAITGGLRGPFAPFLFINAVMPILLFGDPRYLMWHQAHVVAMILILGYLPEDVLGPLIAKEQQAVITAALAIGVLIMITTRMQQFVAAAKASVGELDRMREERLAEASERLQRMQSVGNRIAHELKNPLAAIKSLVQLTSKSSADKDRERLTVVEDEIARMEAILRDYLSFSRPIDDLHIVPIDMRDVVIDVREVLSARAETAGVALAADPERTQLTGDGRRLKEALINLVGNAIEATPPGGRVEIRCVPTESRAGGACIIIEDNGRGMTPEHLAQVGTPFFTTRPGGTGLGVHLARGVIAQHGGTVAFTSAPGVGTSVTITLPASPPGPPGAAACGQP